MPDSTPAPAESPKLELPSSIYSPEQLDAYSLELSRYMGWMRDAQVRSKLGVKSQEADDAEPTLSADLITLINQWHAGKKISLGSLETLSKDLLAFKATLPVVHVTLAGVAGPAVKRKIVEWFRREIGPHILVGFSANRNLGGGIVVRTPSKVYDFSFRQALVASRDRIPEILRSVR